jgi:choline dehydrogenase-like flavoprotein
MLIDTRRIDEGSVIEAEVCIIGGGAAGITIARELDREGIRTCLLESGGHRADHSTRDLYRGESVGLPYRFADGCRSRFLGGSSNCWGGWCRPLEDFDFASRPWVPYSGWPFSKSELEPYYERSHAILRLGPKTFETDFWVDAIGRGDVKRLPLTSGRVVDGISQFSPPVRFGRDYLDELQRSPHVTIYLYANAVDIETDDGGGEVRSVRIATLTGRRVRASAKVFVLATGGIENARLMLLSSRGRRPDGLGNHNGLVGRFFMDHPRVYGARVRPHGQWARNRLYDHKYHYHSPAVAACGTCVAAALSLPPSIQQREGLLNGKVWFASIFHGEDSEAKDALMNLRRLVMQRETPDQSVARDLSTLVTHPGATTGYVLARFVRPRWLVKGCRLEAIVEPEPDPDSRVTLSDERDPLGLRRVKVDWRLGANVKRTFDRNFAIVAEELRAAGVADVDLDPPIADGPWPDSFSEEGTWHHIGTTRMHDSPKLGVVDRDCRVHGVNNLFVAGSSTFPTAGGNFPTITLVALALRLSDHIIAELYGSVGAAASIVSARAGSLPPHTRSAASASADIAASAPGSRSSSDTRRA